MKMLFFSQALLAWFDIHGRKNLPWQHPRTPYQVWISEIMLQQTQVQTVIPYFNRFMDSFPDIKSLAKASLDEVLAHWSGLGYYSRARNIHQAAQIINQQFNGTMPAHLDALITLPGIGPSTAAAIVSQAFNQPAAILDGNVKRVLARFFKIEGFPEQSAVKKQLMELANACLSTTRAADYTQAIMDLGALCCTNRQPNCQNCPLQIQCLAYQHQEVMLYPNKKEKKKLPTKEEQFLILIKKDMNDDTQIFLEQRPPHGLWGGLWCPPITEPHISALEYIDYKFSFLANEETLLSQFKHTFSHFHLKIKGKLIHVMENSTQIKETTGRWFYPHELCSLGLAKPVSRLIQLAGFL